VYEKRVLRKIFRVKAEEITGGCKKLHNDELHNLYLTIKGMKDY
jgi:hypothetical protein